ncbi:subtilisin-like protease sbt4.4 [Quercus suber]|uniref:Subtilisin-like protease sbt4.4 n=1 Tax=Quercus suber TaxID=58331 RepID=A0AAW0LS00_QUESU
MRRNLLCICQWKWFASSVKAICITVLLSAKEHDLVLSYVNSTKNPQASILKSETIKDAEAPTVVSFSSRGPNFFIPDIIKPDLSAPGVSILAAYSPLAAPSFLVDDPRRVQYNFVSGTSMACPHVSGAAAYVKTFTLIALPMRHSKSLGGEFAYGSGHVNPVEAVRPGLVYEAVKKTTVDH